MEEKIDKKAFVIRYVLNRALAKDSPLNGVRAAEEAITTWEYIEAKTKEPNASN